MYCPKKKKNSTISSILNFFFFSKVEDNQQGNSSEKYDDLTEDPVLESLSKEPMEYTNEPSNYLPKEVTDSLHSVKNICLSVLDLLLLQMVNNLPKKQSRRLSDPSCYDKITNSSNILTSISQNTSLLQSPMIRSFSSPPVSSNISDIHRILDSNKQRQQNDQDYTLCCSLAALLNNVYRLLELDSTANTQQRDGVPATSTHEDVVVLQQQLHTQVATFQQERAAGVISLDNADTSQEMKAIWNETDRLMNVVCNLITQKKQYQEQYAPPAYESQNSSNNQLDSKEDTLSPPAYESLIIPEYHLSFEKKEKESNSTSLNDSPPTTKDLDHLLDAIDRLFDVAPALNDQRASLNENQVKHLAAITLGKTIERLSRGRMEDQRASLPEKHQLLQELIQQIQKSASRSLNNQRVKLTPQQQKKLDFASVRHILERLDKGRYVNQVKQGVLFYIFGNAKAFCI